MTEIARTPRALIAFSDTGGGHRSLSSAVADAMRARGVDVRMEDLFVNSRPGLAYRITRLYPFFVRRLPAIYGAAFHLTNHPTVYLPLIRLFGKRTRQRARAVLVAHQPDVVLSAHPLCTAPILDERDMVGRPPLLSLTAELVTVHASWVDPRIDAFMAASAETVESLRRQGASPERIRRTGLPVGQRFGRVTESPASIRLALGLDPDRFTVLLAGGGEGFGALDRLAAAIDASDLDAQLVVVCGRNDALRARLEARHYRRPVRILGFVDNMPELLHACSVLVGKGGPTTIAEALTAGRPVLLTSVVPGQEEGNDRWIEGVGAGLYTPTHERLLRALGRLERDPAFLAELSAAAREQSFADAAERVASWALELAMKQAALTPGRRRPS
ncbi:MAG TPA: glycosyltransferase [Desulfobacterales bacterium]|nr:glycosyltransferase [Desulfobacterales bacterium]